MSTINFSRKYLIQESSPTRNGSEMISDASESNSVLNCFKTLQPIRSLQCHQISTTQRKQRISKGITISDVRYTRCQLVQGGLAHACSKVQSVFKRLCKHSRHFLFLENKVVSPEYLFCYLFGEGGWGRLSISVIF